MRTARLSHEQIFCGSLVLVNHQNIIQNPAKTHLIAFHPDYPTILLEEQAAKMLSACMQEIHGNGAIVPVSGWRSRGEQQLIWDDSMSENGADFTQQYVAFPGCSEHQTGLAIDLGEKKSEIDFIRPDFPYTGLCQKFRKTAVRYGFIERYTYEKEAITGISHEPWHFRYVGAPHAFLMQKRGLCLEEYIELLKVKKIHCVLENGKSVQVFYVPCKDEFTEITLPDSCCQISGNNIDGFIVTAWEVAV